MNLAVHGLEGDLRQAITYYDDPHELLGRADYVMAKTVGELATPRECQRL